jgi:hypothetical protein
MRKTLGKPGFTSGEDRNRTFGCFLDVFEEFERYQCPSTLPLKTTRNRFPPCFRVFGVFRGSHIPCFRVFGVFRVFRGSHIPSFRVFGVFRGSHTPCFRVLASGLYRFLRFNPDPKA